jgi:hypothetical protein
MIYVCVTRSRNIYLGSTPRGSRSDYSRYLSLARPIPVVLHTNTLVLTEIEKPLKVIDKVNRMEMSYHEF